MVSDFWDWTLNQHFSNENRRGECFKKPKTSGYIFTEGMFEQLNEREEMCSAMFESYNGSQEYNQSESSDLITFKRLVCFL